MSELPNLGEVRRLFAQTGDARALATSPADLEAVDAKVSELLLPILAVTHELVEWLALHESEGDLSLSITWHERFVLVEARDIGTELPKTESVRADAEWAARVLAPPASEWCAEIDEDGRKLWVTLSTSRHRPEAMRS